MGKAVRVVTVVLSSILVSLSSNAASGLQPAAQSGDAILQQALLHADWFNWAEATSEFQEAERLFTEQHDSRNALYAKVGVLRATTRGVLSARNDAFAISLLLSQGL